MAGRSAIVAALVALAGCGRTSPPPAPAHAATQAAVPAKPSPPAKDAADPWAAGSSSAGSGSAHAPIDRATLAKRLVADPSGTRHPLGDCMRQVTLFAFWASWCHPCMQEIPQLAKYAASVHDPRIAVIAVNVDDDHAAATKAIAKLHGLTIVLDPQHELYDALFGGLVMSIPATAIVSPDGIDVDASGYAPGSDDEVVKRFAASVAAHLH